MEKVNVKRDELIERLKENRDQHEQDYEDAHLIWRDNAIDYIDQTLLQEEEDHQKHLIRVKEQYAKVAIRLKEMRAGYVDWNKHMDGDGLGREPEPQSHVKDYDAAITMLEMSVDTEMEIKAGIFRQLVMDMWDWKESFEATTSAYFNSGKVGLLGDAGPRGDAGDIDAEGRNGTNGLRTMQLNHLKAK